MAAAIGGIGIGMLRSIGGRAPHQAPEEPEAPPPNLRIVYRCEACGMELLLLRGGQTPLRHCGEPMRRREEMVP
jgi:hypothetical protein